MVLHRPVELAPLIGMWESAFSNGEHKEKNSKLPACGGLLMFTDLFHLIHSLEHDYKEEKGQKVHSYYCRRCALTVRLSGFKGQILCLLRDIEFSIGEPINKNKRS